MSQGLKNMPEFFIFQNSSILVISDGVICHQRIRAQILNFSPIDGALTYGRITFSKNMNISTLLLKKHA